VRARLALTTALNALAFGLSILIGIALTPLMLRSLGPDAYGLWALITTFSVTAGYLGVLDFGIQSSVVKLVAEFRQRHDSPATSQVVSAALYLFGGLGIIGAGALIGFGTWFLESAFRIPAHLVDIARLLFYMLAVQTLFEFPELILAATLEGVQRYDVQRAIQVAYVVLSGLSVAILLLLGHGLLALSVTAAGLSIVRLLASLLFVWRLAPEIHLVPVVDRLVMRRLVTFSSQIFLLRLNGIAHNTMDKAIIGVLLTTTALTEYDIANKLRLVAAGTLGFITPQVVPIAAMLHARGDRERLKELFLSGTKFQLALTLPVVISVFVFAEPIVLLWIGSDYEHIVDLGRLFVSYLLLNAAIDVGYNMMIGMGHVRHLLVIQTSTTTIINLLVSILLTPRIGTAGVMWGTLIGMATGVVPYLGLFLRSLDLPFAELLRRAIFPTYLVAAGYGLLLYGASTWVRPDTLISLGALASVCLTIYGLVVWRFSLSDDERVSLRKALRVSR